MSTSDGREANRRRSPAGVSPVSHRNLDVERRLAQPPSGLPDPDQRGPQVPLDVDREGLQQRGHPAQRVALLHRGGGAVVAGDPAQHPTTYDGPAVAPAGPLPQALTFEGHPGAWLRAQDGSDTDDAAYASVLLGPDRDPPTTCPPPHAPLPWPDRAVAAPDRRVLDPALLPRAHAALLDGGRTARGGGHRAAADPDRRRTHDVRRAAPGRAVIAPAETGGFLRLTTAYPGGPLAAYAGAAETPVCAANGPLGCGDGAYATVSVDHPVDTSPFFGWVYVPFTIRETGPIDLQVTSRLDRP